MSLFPVDNPEGFGELSVTEPDSGLMGIYNSGIATAYNRYYGYNNSAYSYVVGTYNETPSNISFWIGRGDCNLGAYPDIVAIGGQVGIGTQIPRTGATIDVAGSIYSSGKVAQAYTVAATWSLAATSNLSLPIGGTAYANASFATAASASNLFSTNTGKITFAEPGIYSVSAVGTLSAAGGLGVYLEQFAASAPSTAIPLAASVVATGAITLSASYTGYFAAGDALRPSWSGAGSGSTETLVGTAPGTAFSIALVQPMSI